jgi:hypothetical protein
MNWRDGGDVCPLVLPDARLTCHLQLDPAQPLQCLQPLDQLVEGPHLGGAPAPHA